MKKINLDVWNDRQVRLSFGERGALEVEYAFSSESDDQHFIALLPYQARNETEEISLDMIQSMERFHNHVLDLKNIDEKPGDDPADTASVLENILTLVYQLGLEHGQKMIRS